MQGKYSFAVMSAQDYVFVDGNSNNVEVLNKNDLSLMATLSTDNNAVFSMIMIGQKLFAGCSNNNLFVFEIDPTKLSSHTPMKRSKDLKSTSFIYCFFQLDYNTLLCG